MMNSRLRLSIGENFLDAVLGYAVVFVGLSLLMLVVILVGKIMIASKKKETERSASASAASAISSAESLPASPMDFAPGSAGELKLYDTDPRDAAMIMAIVANKLDKPLNELRFRSIKEVK